MGTLLPARLDGQSRHSANCHSAEHANRYRAGHLDAFDPRSLARRGQQPASAVPRTVFQHLDHAVAALLVNAEHARPLEAALLQLRHALVGLQHDLLTLAPGKGIQRAGLHASRRRIGTHPVDAAVALDDRALLAPVAQHVGGAG